MAGIQEAPGAKLRRRQKADRSRRPEGGLRPLLHTAYVAAREATSIDSPIATNSIVCRLHSKCWVTYQPNGLSTRALRFLTFALPQLLFIATRMKSGSYFLATLFSFPTSDDLATIFITFFLPELLLATVIGVAMRVCYWRRGGVNIRGHLMIEEINIGEGVLIVNGLMRTGVRES